MSVPTKKIALTVLLLIVLVVIFSFLRIGEYSVSQDYAYEAVGQLEDSNTSYEILKSQSGVNKLFIIGKLLVSLVFIFFVFKIWKPKKSTE